MLNGKTILVAPLDWGLGHATRCVPVIRQLMAGNRIILGVTAITKPVFDEEFPALPQVPLPSYGVKYSTLLPLWLKLAFDSPRIAAIVKEEHECLQAIINTHRIDTVISDNRFGMHHRDVHSIFITHQLFLKAPFLTPVLQNVNRNYILRFDEVWVPDLENENECLSGELSHAKEHYHPNVKYIGPQSRLRECPVSGNTSRYDKLILLSGPEPLRTELEQSLAALFKTSTQKIAMVRGTDAPEELDNGAIDVFGLPTARELKALVLNSNTIICRSGYSTLMDMHALAKKNLMLIPTPGQSEQEYLAAYWEKKFGAVSVSQNKLNRLLA